MSDQVITRFAPSPTGFLHIGGARTALFNWLYAKRHGGKMLLRIEDTDRERSTDEAVAAILDGLSWLGLDWDGEPVSQSAGVERHQAIVEQMLNAGTAYRCYASAEELETMREQARAEGRSPAYDGRWRDKDPSEAPDGVAPVIRVKSPNEGITVVHDKVQGEVRIPNKDIDDFVILRSDGTPTYMLAVVVDDHDMGVTHVIRGDDHLTNAARQTILFNALNWKVPVFAHIPLIHGPDGAKLSKRHGALGAEAYRALGYLPDALKNYLVRLGWAKGDEEIITLDDMIAWFGFEGMNKAAARFDFAKLEALNAHYMRHSEVDDLMHHVDLLLSEIEGGAEISTKIKGDKRERFIQALPLLTDRSKTLVELVENAAFVYNDCPLPLTEKAVSILDAAAKENLSKLVKHLEPVKNWTHDELDQAMRAFLQENELKLGKVGPALRCALTGTTNAPGIFEVLTVLGRDEAIARIKDHLN